MGETKKRRNTKHRGNAAGMVESRGRTGARPVGSAGGGGTGPRVPQPANWNKALLKGLIPLVILAVVMFGFSKQQRNITSVITLLAVAYLLYVPIVYYTDRYMYNRYLKRGR